MMQVPVPQQRSSSIIGISMNEDTYGLMENDYDTG